MRKTNKTSRIRKPRVHTIPKVYRRLIDGLRTPSPCGPQSWWGRILFVLFGYLVAGKAGGELGAILVEPMYGFIPPNTSDQYPPPPPPDWVIWSIRATNLTVLAAFGAIAIGALTVMHQSFRVLICVPLVTALMFKTHSVYFWFFVLKNSFFFWTDMNGNILGPRFTDPVWFVLGREPWYAYTGITLLYLIARLAPWARNGSDVSVKTRAISSRKDTQNE